LDVRSQLKNAQIEQRATSPTKKSEIVYNTVSNEVEVMDNADAKALVTKTGTQTLTNKTLTSPVISTPTGIVKGDIGLGNVDNTSDATKNAAAVALTNKTINADLNTISNIDNADIKAGAAIAHNKMAALTTYKALISDGDGFVATANTSFAEIERLVGLNSTAVGVDDIQTLTNKTLTAPVIDVASLTEQGSTPATPSAGSKKFYAKTDGKLYTLNSSGVEVEVGSGASGSGSTNFIDNGQAVTNTTGWATYGERLTFATTDVNTGTDTITITSHGLREGHRMYISSTTTVPAGLAAATLYRAINVTANTFQVANSTTGALIDITSQGAGTHSMRPLDPIDGTGGTVTFSTLTRSTSSPLSGAASFLLDASISNAVGEGVSYDFSIDAASKGRNLEISFDYIVASGTFLTATATEPGNICVWIYDVTNSRLIEPSNKSLFSNSATIAATYTGTFQASSDSTSYRLIFHLSSIANSAASGFRFDNVSVSPSTYAYGTPVSDWETCTVTGSWVANTTYTARRRRVGDTKEYDILVSTSGAPTSTNLTVNLPAGDVIDTAKITGSSATEALGVMSILDNGVNDYHGLVRYNNTTSVLPRYFTGATTLGANVNQAAPFTFGASDAVHLKFSVPIVGLSSSVQMSDNAETRVVASRAYLAANQTSVNPNASAVKITHNTIASGNDTHAAFNTSSNRYVVQTSGWYRINSLITVSATNVLANNYHLDIYINGVQASIGPSTRATVGVEIGLAVSDLKYLNSSDYVEIFLYGAGNNSASTLTVLGGSALTYFNISRDNGPSAIAANETIAGYYYTTAAPTVNNTNPTITYGTKVYDTHGAYSGSTLTIPANGLYQFKMFLQTASVAWTAGNGLQAGMTAAGTAYIVGATRAWASTNTINEVGGAIDIRLSAGDTVTFQLYSDTSTTASASAHRVRVQWQRVGL
jgi:hypothetical protein